MQQPAQAESVGFTDEAAAQLVDDLRSVREMQPDGSTLSKLGDVIEPVQLQVVCRRLWNGLATDDSVIDIDDVRKEGDVNTALRNYYDDTISAVKRDTGIDERHAAHVGREADHRGGIPHANFAGPRPGAG